MIELTDYRGNKVLIHIKDIRQVNGYFDERYPNIQSVIILYDGKKIECSLPYNEVKKLTIPVVMPRISHFEDAKGVVHGEANDEQIKHIFEDGILKWYVDYETEKVYLTPVEYGA